jgi:hypothetical protein
LFGGGAKESVPLRLRPVPMPVALLARFVSVGSGVVNCSVRSPKFAVTVRPDAVENSVPEGSAVLLWPTLNVRNSSRRRP